MTKVRNKIGFFNEIPTEVYIHTYIHTEKYTNYNLQPNKLSQSELIHLTMTHLRIRQYQHPKNHQHLLYNNYN